MIFYYRDGGAGAWVKDSPITNVGHFQAKLIGESIKDKNVKIDIVYSSPAYRCVQTADSVLKSKYYPNFIDTTTNVCLYLGMGVKDSVPIRIEPGLFEWLGFLHQNFPPYFTPEQLQSQGFNIDIAYKPHLTCDQLRERLDETVTKLYERNFGTMKAILQNTTSGNILVVAHAISLETCSRMIVGKTERQWQELYSVFSNCAFCSMVALERIEGEKLQFVEPPAGSITSSSNGSFDWKAVANS